MGIFLKTLKRHSASRRVPQQAFQLVTPMRWDLGVCMERKPVDTGTAGARQCGVFTFTPKARANAAHVLSGPLPTGDALRDGGRHGAGERGLVVTQRADDPPTDLLDHVSCSAGADVCDVGVGRHFDLEKARLATLVGAIEIDTLKEDQVIAHIEIERTLKALDKRDRPRLDLLSLSAAFDRLVQESLSLRDLKTYLGRHAVDVLAWSYAESVS